MSKRSQFYFFFLFKWKPPLLHVEANLEQAPPYCTGLNLAPLPEPSPSQHPALYKLSLHSAGFLGKDNQTHPPSPPRLPRPPVPCTRADRDAVRIYALSIAPTVTRLNLHYLLSYTKLNILMGHKLNSKK